MSKPKPAHASTTGQQEQRHVEKPSSIVSSQSKETLTYSSGPIPNPETLAKYNQIHPGLAQDIITSFKAEYEQRHQMETLSMKGDIEAMRLSHTDVSRGQWLGFVICFLGISGGSTLVYLGHDTAGAVIGTTGLASVAAALLGNKTTKISN